MERADHYAVVAEAAFAGAFDCTYPAAQQAALAEATAAAAMSQMFSAIATAARTGVQS
jgi:hypothetical protein